MSCLGYIYVPAKTKQITTSLQKKCEGIMVQKRERVKNILIECTGWCPGPYQVVYAPVTL